jgi:sugar lactone lactonase YvrE
VATSRDDPGLSATATVIVVQPELELLAGHLGGTGSANGSGTDARFTYPFGIVSDGAGILYVTDLANGSVRRFSIATREVDTLAGAPFPYLFADRDPPTTEDGFGLGARFYNPGGIARDSRGNLYVADVGDHVIRLVYPSSGQVKTIAGSAGARGSADGKGLEARFSKPTGLALDGGTLYISETSNNTIRAMDLASGRVSTLAGDPGITGARNGFGSKAQFSDPSAILADGKGSLYVADQGNEMIRRVVVATGEVTTFCGQQSIGPKDGPCSEALFKEPSGLVLDGDNLYVIEHTAVRRISISTATVTTVSGGATVGGRDGTRSEAEFSRLAGGALDGKGNLIVADMFNNDLRAITLSTGTTTTVAAMPRYAGSDDGVGEQARFDVPEGIASDGKGGIFVVDFGGQSVRKVAIDSGAVSTLMGIKVKRAPHSWLGLAARGGDLYMSVWDAHTVRALDPEHRSATTFAGLEGQWGSADGTGTDARFTYPGDLAFDDQGTLFVADAGNDTIRRISRGGEVTTVAGVPQNPGNADGVGPSARFNYPRDVEPDGQGNLYVADSLNHTIRKIVVSSGEVTTYAGRAGEAGHRDGSRTDARFQQPIGLAADRSGHLFVVDQLDSTVREVDLATGIVTTLIGSPGEAGVILGPLPARINHPTGIAISSAGDLVISDSAENAMLVVRPPY